MGKRAAQTPAIQNNAAEPPEKQRDGGFFRTFLREWGRITSTPFYIIFTFIIPCTAFALFSAAFENPMPRELPYVVHDADASPLSRQLIRMAEASPFLKRLEKTDSLAAGAERVREGRAYAVLHIPAGFERDIKRAAAPEAVIYCNTQWLLTSGLVSRALREAAGTLSAGIELRTRMMQGEDPAAAMDKFQPIALEQHPLFNPYLSYRDFLMPPLFFALLNIFFTMITVHAVGVELRRGTAGGWLEAAGGSSVFALFGKLLPHTLLFMLLNACALTWLYRWQQIPFRGDAWTVAWGSLLFILACQSMGFFFPVLTSNQRMAGSLAGFYTGPAFAFAGFTFPAAGMPAAAKVWGMCLPLTWYGRLMLAQASRGAAPAASLTELTALAVMAVAPPLLLFPRFRHLLRDPACWGKM
jgi:ABC-2 type transport system permease protein